MKKKLPINMNPEVRSYSYYSYPQCIISASEHMGEIVAQFSISEYENAEWKLKTEDLELQNKSGQFTAISTNKFREKMNGCILRELKAEDHICISIDFQQYAHPWGAINLFITDMDDDKVVTEDDSYLCRMGIFNRDGVYFRSNNIAQSMQSDNAKAKFNQVSPSVLLLYRKKNVIEGYIGTCKEDLILAYRTEIDLSNMDKLFIGAQVKMNDNVYFKWLFSNYIQLSFTNSYYAWRMDFFYGVIKEWKFNWINYFLNSYYIDLRYVNKYGSLSFLKENIDRNCYVEVMLDQYYIENREEYHSKHHLHQNMIYGYDDSKRSFLILGYLNNGHLATSYISYRDIKHQFEKRKEVKDIYIVEYQQDAKPIEYNLSYILKMIRQYYQSEVSGNDFNMIVCPQDEWKYGISIYDKWLEGYGIERLLDDRRITHLLYEHKKLMYERVEYLVYKENIERDISRGLLNGFKEIQDSSLELRNLVLKYCLSDSEEIKCKVAKYLCKIRDEEKKWIGKLLDLFSFLV